MSSAYGIADERLVADYLNRLAAASATLPADQRAELFEEISLHIAEARAVQATAGAETSLPVADVLERLGRPEDIVRAAADDTETGPITPVPVQRPPRRRVLDTGTVILLLVGGLLIGLGWIAGAVMLWASPRWRTSDKLLGTLIWPGGLAAVLAIPRFGTGLPPLLALSLLLVGVAGPIVAATRLLRRAWRTSAGPHADPHALHPAR
ncbi:MAG TPA: hypothetical protein VMB74_00475 [Streptosporangiaceae bacterium]|nr:hypothetical protein [Streptosporangiaceae bacterium]